MNQLNNQQERETYFFDGTEYEVHDLPEYGQAYPRYPFVVNIPHLCFTPIQLHAYLTSYFQMIRGLEMQYIQMYHPTLSPPFQVYCGYCNSPHVVNQAISPGFVQHMSTGTIAVPQWTPLFLRRSTDGTDSRQN